MNGPKHLFVRHGLDRFWGKSGLTAVQHLRVPVPFNSDWSHVSHVDSNEKVFQAIPQLDDENFWFGDEKLNRGMHADLTCLSEKDVLPMIGSVRIPARSIVSLPSSSAPESCALKKTHARISQ